MIDLKSLERYPDLLQFLNSKSEQQRLGLAHGLRSEYVVVLDGERTILSLMQIVCAMGKLYHLNTLLKSQQIDSYWQSAQRLFNSESKNDIMTLDTLNSPFELACKGGHTPVINRLLEFNTVRWNLWLMFLNRCSITDSLTYNFQSIEIYEKNTLRTRKILLSTLISGNLDLFKYLESRIQWPANDKHIRFDPCKIKDAAQKFSRALWLSGVRYWAECNGYFITCITTTKVSIRYHVFYEEPVFITLIKQGKLETIKFFYENFYADLYFYYANSEGHIPTKYIEQYCICQIPNDIRLPNYNEVKGCFTLSHRAPPRTPVNEFMSGILLHLGSVYYADGITKSVKPIKDISPEIIRALFDSVADREMATPHQAELIRSLINHNFDDRCLEVAAQSEQDEVVDYLISKRTTDLPSTFIFPRYIKIIDRSLSAKKAADLNPEDQEKILTAAAESGDIDSLKSLLIKIPPNETTRKNIFKAACLSGQLEMLQYVCTHLNIENTVNHLDLDDIDLLLGAVFRAGYVHIIDYLKEHYFFLFEKINLAIESKQKITCLLNETIKGGRTELLELLQSYFPKLIEHMSQSKIPSIYEITNENIEVLNWAFTTIFRSKTTNENDQDFVACSLFSSAVYNGYADIVKRLIEFNAVEEMFLDPSKTASILNTISHHDVFDIVLNYSDSFAIAEIHEEYNLHTLAFIAKKVTALRQQKKTFERKNTEIAFDVSLEDAKLCFYMIRYLIRINQLAFIEDIQFLLDIRSVNQLANGWSGYEYSAERPALIYQNELLQLAQTLNNEPAASVLLSISHVRQLAEANNYYRDTAEDALDLQRIITHKESAMMALSPIEEKRLVKAAAIYDPIINHSGGIEANFRHLKEALIQRYQQNPAKILVDGNEITLPCEWRDFQALSVTAHPVTTSRGLSAGSTDLEVSLDPAVKPREVGYVERHEPLPLSLNETQRNQALKAYHRHKTHTALRFLLEPNDWLAERPIHADGANRCARFHSHKPLIVLCWKAASDEKRPPLEGNVDLRIEHFIDELALTGREHNRDRYIVKVDIEDKPILLNGKEQIGQYDDLRPDEPSCAQGIRKRLAQSVFDHPILDPKIKKLTLKLTETILQQEIREFVKAHIIDAITCENRLKFKNAYDAYVLELNLDARSILKQLDVSPGQQKKFIKALRKKYGKSFDDDPNFMSMIKNQLTISDKEILVGNFAQTINLEGILTNEKAILENDFNRLLAKLHTKVEALKANAYYFSEYQPVSQLAETRYKMLKEAGEAFFKHPITAITISAFQAACTAATAEDDLINQHRGWAGLNQYLKGFLTILAHVLILPAVIVAFKSKHGYQKTFFGQYPSDTSEQFQAARTGLEEIYAAAKMTC